MKKLLTVCLALAMAASMTACGSKEAPAPAATEAPAAETEAAETEAAETEAAAEETEAPAEEAADSDMAAIQAKGTLIVGITDFEPMDYKNEAGEWIGFDADMAKAFADSLGVACEFVEIDWDNKIMELNGGTIDCVWNGMTLTDEVLSSMECTNCYSSNSQVIVLKADAIDQYEDVESMKDLTFAVEAGSAGESAATEAGLATTPVKAQADALMEVAAGTSDGAVIDLLMAKAMVGEGTSYADLASSFTLVDEEYGVGFRKGSDLAAALNDFFKAAYADGSMIECATTYGIEGSIVEQ